MTDDSATAGRVTQGTFSTPLEPAPRLATAIGLRKDQLWMKWDDLTGLGGGNRVRKLERTLATALRGGADALVATGAAQSNYARLTAAASARLGIFGGTNHQVALHRYPAGFYSPRSVGTTPRIGEPGQRARDVLPRGVRGAIAVRPRSRPSFSRVGRRLRALG
jgi:hypothetical protein